MPTWVFFLGVEAVTIVICVVATVIWMNRGGEEDAYDCRLKELAEQELDAKAEAR